MFEQDLLHIRIIGKILHHYPFISNAAAAATDSAQLELPFCQFFPLPSFAPGRNDNIFFTTQQSSTFQVIYMSLSSLHLVDLTTCVCPEVGKVGCQNSSTSSIA